MSKDGKDAASQGRDGYKGVYLLPEMAFSFYSFYDLSTSPHLYFESAYKQLCFLPAKLYK